MASFTTNNDESSNLNDKFWQSNRQLFKKKKEHVMNATMKKFLSNRIGESDVNPQIEFRPPIGSARASTSDATRQLRNNQIEMAIIHTGDDTSSVSSRSHLVNQ